MSRSGHHEPEQIREAQNERDPLPAKIAAGENQRDQRNCRDRHEDDRAEARVLRREGDDGELRHQGQEVDHQQVCQRKASPPLAEPLEDHGGVALARGDAQSCDHLLNEVADRQQDEHQPEQVQAVLPARLSVAGNGPRVIVGFHDNQARPDHQEMSQEPLLPGRADGDSFGGCSHVVSHVRGRNSVSCFQIHVRCSSLLNCQANSCRPNAAWMRK